MLIMALAHAQKSGDGGLIHEYYELLMKWADYLAPNALEPKGLCVVFLLICQILADNSMYPSLTSDRIGATSNLALKAILGIYAMGKINQALEVRGADSAKTNYYLVSCLQYLLSNLLNATIMQSTASDYAKQWEALAFTTDHITTSYGSEASWGLVYNMYVPRLLGTNIVSEKVSILRDKGKLLRYQ